MNGDWSMMVKTKAADVVFGTRNLKKEGKEERMKEKKKEKKEEREEERKK